MADGEIRIKVSVDGKDVEATVSGLDKMQESSKKAGSGIKDIATSLGLVKVAGKAIDVLSNSLDSAIKRFDTIERYPKVMESLGYGAETSRESIEKLSAGIEGLPTTLDSVVSSTQRMATITGQLGKSTDAVIALNNSFMANGASVSDAERGMTQYLQMLSKGTVDIVSWRTLQETMGVALRKTADAMGYLGSNGVNELYSALQSGKTTFREFQDNLIEIATGTGEIANLAKQNSQGIVTSFTNLKTAVSRNMADLVKVFDTMSKEITGKTIAENIDSMKDGINSAFKSINSTVKKSTPVFKTFISVVKGTISVAKSLSPVIVGVASAYAGFKIISTVNGLIKKSNALINTAKAANKGLTTTLSLYNTESAKRAIAESSNIAVTKAQIAVQAAQNGTIGLGTAAIGLLTGALTAHEAITIAATVATNALNTAISFIGGPVGIAVAAIGLLATGFAVNKKALDNSINSTDGLVASTERLIKKTDEATEGISDNIAARKTEVEDIDATTDAYNALADELDGLISSEHKSATEKSRIQTIVDSLNGSLEGLGLAYDKENDSLSIGTGLLKDRISTLQEMEKAEAAKKNVTQIEKDSKVITTELNKLYAKRNKIEEEYASQKNTNAQLFAKHDVSLAESASSYTKSLEKINGKIKEQEGNLKELETQKIESDSIIANSQKMVDEAIQNGVMTQTMSYEQLTESQKEAVDSMNSKWQEYQDQATNMFDVLSNEQTMSVDEMISNLETNQQIMSQWADNISALADRGVNQGLLDKLRDAGPESAGYVAALVSASDEQLQHLNTAFENGGTTATDSLKKAFDFEGSGIQESITGLVTQTQTSLREQMASADFASLTADMGTDLANGINQNAESVKSSSEQLGKNIPDGVASGISGNIGVVKDPVTILCDSLNTGFTSYMGINSPSTLFAEHGKYIIEGLKNGISNNKEAAISAMKEVATSLPKVFDGVDTEFYQIGSYLMDGLASGINDNANTAVAAAEAAAARVKAATQKAYDEHSPSKWMKNFVGKYLMYGLAEGLEKYTDAPVNAMLKSSEAIKLPMITAEMAIGSDFIGRQTCRPVNNYYHESGNEREMIKAINRLANRPVVVSTQINSHEIVKTTALPMNDELNSINKFKNMLKGVR